MRVVRDLNTMPDPAVVNPLEWKRLARGGKEGFDFNDSHEPWEFPLISELGRVARVTTWQLDEDADITLRRWGALWARDVLGRGEKLARGSAVDQHLLEAARAMEEALGEIGDLGARFSHALEEQRRWQGEQRELGKPYYGRSMESPFSERIAALSHERSSAEELMEDGPLRSLLISLVRSKYVLSSRGRGEFIASIYSLEDPENREEQRYYLDKVARDVQHAYQYSLVAFPGENLPSYFYDEMLYSEAIETTSAADSGCRDILEEAVEHGINDEWLIAFLENGGEWRGWWS